MRLPGLCTDIVSDFGTVDVLLELTHLHVEGGPRPVSPDPGPGLGLPVWFRQRPEVRAPQALLPKPPAVLWGLARSP